MKFLSVFRKTMQEQLRDLTVLSLTLVFAPLFVFLYWLFFPSGSTSFGVLIINQDPGIQLANGSTFDAGALVMEAIDHVTYPDGNPLLRARRVESFEAAESLLREREATAFIIIPEDFSRVLATATQDQDAASATVVFGGDLTNPYYAIAAILTTSAVETTMQDLTGRKPLIEYKETPLGGSAARTEFETYVPGILIFAVIMLIFTASMTVAREIEAGTLRRLQITRLKPWEFLGGITSALMIVGIVSIMLAFLTAAALGFRSQGPLWVAILIGALTSLSIIGAGMVVASFSTSVARAFVIANFPLGLFMFFSGVIYPVPKVTLFSLAGHTVGLYDILPATHAVAALNKILNLGVDLEGVLYELTSLALLSIGAFAFGVWLFGRRHMRAG